MGPILEALMRLLSDFRKVSPKVIQLKITKATLSTNLGGLKARVQSIARNVEFLPKVSKAAHVRFSREMKNAVPSSDQISKTLITYFTFT